MLSPCRTNSMQEARSTVKTGMSDVFPFPCPLRAFQRPEHSPELSAWLVWDNVPHSVSKCAVSQSSGISATSKGESSHRGVLVSDWWPGGWGGVERRTLGHWHSLFPCSDNKPSTGVCFLPPSQPALSAPPPLLSWFTSPPLCPAFAERKRLKCHKRPRVAQFQTPGQHVFSEQECKKHCIQQLML